MTINNSSLSLIFAAAAVLYLISEQTGQVSTGLWGFLGGKLFCLDLVSVSQSHLSAFQTPCPRLSTHLFTQPPIHAC